MSKYNHSRGQDYVSYNDKYEVDDLNQNVWWSSDGIIASGATGRHLYKNEPREEAPYIKSEYRDKEIHYIIGVERDNHPDHFSRFGYANCPNGYCTGPWPGRFATSLACSKNIMPPGMAPKRFYSEELSGVFAVRSQAIEDYNSMMGL